MALANVAWILASRGQRVLMIDWDLEAPGLHRYFRAFIEDTELTYTPGLIDFLVEFVEGARLQRADADADWFKKYTSISRYAFSLDCEFPNEGALDLLPAGRQGAGYSARVTAFDWSGFYDQLGGGVFLEAFKEGLREEYDWILIDSRTGISDTSGICTIQMPDDLVVCFTLNTQSIRGAAATAESAFSQRKLASGAPGIRIWPIPTRVELAERDRLEAARTDMRWRFQKYMHHMPPARRSSYWGSAEILYQPFYAYEELLATLMDRPGQKQSLLQSFEQLTANLTGGKIKALEPLAAAQHRHAPEPFAGLPDGMVALEYGPEQREGAHRLLAQLRRHLGQLAVIDATEAPMNSQARVVLLLLTKSSFSSQDLLERGKYAWTLHRVVLPVLTDKESWQLLRSIPSPLADLTLNELRWEPKQAFEVDTSKLADRIRSEFNTMLYYANDTDENDPLRGRFGGQPRTNQYSLSAKVTAAGDDWYNVELVVRGTKAYPLSGVVEFHLHPTFEPSVIQIEAKRGEAKLLRQAWGAFTVGAVIMSTLSMLELDLAALKSAPKNFREN